MARTEVLHQRVKLTEALLRARTDTATYSGRRISVDFKHVPLADLLRQISKEGGVPIEIDPKVQGTYGFKFTDTPWDQILDVVLMTANLDWEVQHGTLHVSARPAPATP